MFYRTALKVTRDSVTKEFYNEWIRSFVDVCRIECDEHPPTSEDSGVVLPGWSVCSYAYAEAIQDLYDNLDKYIADPSVVEFVEKNIEKANLRKLSDVPDVGDLVDHILQDVERIGYSSNMADKVADKLADALENLWHQQCYDPAEQAFDKQLKKVARYLANIDGKYCYRLMALPVNKNPTDLDYFGIYWSLDPRKVGMYAPVAKENNRSAYWRFRATVDSTAVDAQETISANLDPEFGDAEREVRFKRRKQIFVHDAQRIYDYRGDKRIQKGLEYGGYALGPKVKINQYMKTT